MKQVLNSRIATAVACIGLAALTTSCGKKGAAENLGYYNNIPGSAYPGNIGGCIPINQPISFVGNNNYYDWANIYAGAIPGSNQTIGTLYVGAGGTGGPYTRSGSDGTISLNVTPANGTPGGIYPPYATNGYNVPSGYPAGYPTSPQVPNGYNYGAYSNPYFGQNGGTANINGVLQLSQLVQQDIYYRTGSQLGYGSGYGYPNGYGGYGNGQYYPMPGVGQYPGQTPGYPSNGQGICVSGIALNLGHYYNTIYGGQVYLYLNGTQHGYVLYF